jgi:hypothetical protein
MIVDGRSIGMAEMTDGELRDEVRSRYAMAATAVTFGATNGSVLAAESCCGSGDSVALDETFGAVLCGADQQSRTAG